MATEPTATIRLVWPFLSLSAELRSRRSEEWDQSRLEDRRRDPEARVPHSTINRLLSVGAAHVGLPDYALLAAEQVRPGDLDLLELIACSRSTLGEALSCLPRLLPLLHDAAELIVTEESGTTEVRVGFRGVALHPQGYDFLLALAVLSARRSLGRPDFSLRAVFLPYPARADLSVYRRIFGEGLCFNQPYAALRFDSEAMSLPMLHASPTVSAALERVATELLSAGYPRTSFRARVVAAIGEELSLGGECTAARVAKRLGVSLRTLQRRLDEGGTHYRAVLDDHRARLACAYLRRPDLSTAEIAYLVGFASSQAFHKAFRRWHGKTPAEYRNMALPPNLGVGRTMACASPVSALNSLTSTNGLTTNAARSSSAFGLVSVLAPDESRSVHTLPRDRPED